MSELMSDRAEGLTKNVLSYLECPPDPDRVCTCGYRPDGSFIRECSACKKWRQQYVLVDGCAPVGIAQVTSVKLVAAQTELVQMIQAQAALLLRQTTEVSGTQDAQRERARLRKCASQNIMRAQIRVTRLQKALAALGDHHANDYETDDAALDCLDTGDDRVA